MDNDTADKNVEKAIDDIFDTDFIEIDISDDKEVSAIENKINFSSEEEKIEINNENKVNEPITIENDLLKDNVINKEENNFIEDKDNIDINDNIEIKNDNNQNNIDIADTSENKIVKSDKKKSNFKNIFIIIVICLILIVALFIIYYLFFTKKEGVTNCSYSAEDSGYKITDEYKITYSSNDISYVEAKYIYKAKTEEYKNQIEVIKEEKLPVILNSYGMSGFTYLYEVGDDYISINSYLDFNLFDYNVIDKNNPDTNPISYIKINSSVNYDKLIKQFEANGYKCVLSK